MTVTAKLYVANVERGAGAPDTVKVTLAAATRGEENKAWADATPSATFTMTIQNPEASAQFVLNQEFLVTFEASEPVTTLATPHEYTLSEYEQKNGETSYSRCALCNCKRVSHEEPVRSALVRSGGLAVAS